MNNILAIGDSHIELLDTGWSYMEEAGLPEAHKINAAVLHGATITGLGRRNSTLQARDQVLSLAKQSKVLVLGFGQVDVEVGYYYRKVVKEEQWTWDDFSFF